MELFAIYMQGICILDFLSNHVGHPLLTPWLVLLVLLPDKHMSIAMAMIDLAASKRHSATAAGTEFLRFLTKLN